MLNMGWTPAQMTQFLGLLNKPHRIRILVHRLDINHNFLEDISDRFINGQVDFDADASVSRSVKMTFLDPSRTLNIDTFNPADGANYFRQLIRVYYCVMPLDNITRGPGHAEFFAVPLITGAIAKPSRNGIMVNLEVQGKEVLGSSGSLSGNWTSPAGWPVSTVISEGLRVLTGELWFDFDYNPHVLPGGFPLEAGDDIFNELRMLAADYGYQLFYNGWGNLRLRPLSTAAVFTMNDTFITSKPNIEYDLDKLANMVIAKGGNEPRAGLQVISVRHAPDWHPFSAVNLGRAGVKRYLMLTIEDSTVIDERQLDRMAQSALDLSLIQGVSAQFTCFVHPLLEEGDIITINGSEYFGNTRAQSFSIPLVGDAEMSMNFLSTSGYGGRKSGKELVYPAAPDPAKKGGGKKWRAADVYKGGWQVETLGRPGKRKKQKRRGK